MAPTPSSPRQTSHYDAEATKNIGKHLHNDPRLDY
jgi:hypothetical protein